MNFDDILGNDEAKKYLSHCVTDNHISQSYLFVGAEGIGKLLIAKEFAKQVLCLQPEKKQNCQCKSCQCFEGMNHPDYLVINEKGETIKIDQIREITTKIMEPPIISNRKIYILNDCDKMTIEAQNCLLKTLEEPPEFANIILIGSNESNFLSTIKSRCTTIKFGEIPNEEIRQYIKNKYDLQEISDSIIKASNGSIGKAEILKDKQELYTSVDNVINNIEKMDLIDTLKNADVIYKSQEDKKEILEYINIILFEK